MELLVRGKYVLTSATEPTVLMDAAVRVAGDTVAEIGSWTTDVPALYREIRSAAKTIGDEQRRRAEMLQRLKPYYQRWYREWLGGDTQPFYVLNSRI